MKVKNIQLFEDWIKGYREYGVEFMTPDDFYNGLVWALECLKEIAEGIGEEKKNG